jgi:hypothetical protein
MFVYKIKNAGSHEPALYNRSLWLPLLLLKGSNSLTLVDYREPVGCTER